MAKKERQARLGEELSVQAQLHSMMLPGTLLMLMFNIVPLFGLILAFKNYKVTSGIAGIFTSPFYGLQNFKIIFANHDFANMLKNTLGINLSEMALEEGTEEARDRVAFLKSKCLPICLNCVLLGESSLALEFHE